jgi:hypothetical protein
MNYDIELIKKKICEIIFAEREIIKRRYTLYLEEVKQLNSSLDIQIWINNYRYIFTKYGKEDIDKLDIKT